MCELTIDDLIEQKNNDTVIKSYNRFIGRRAKMKATYEMTLKIKIVHDIETINDIKDNSEYAKDICEMICDEAVNVNAVASYEIIDSSFNVK